MGKYKYFIIALILLNIVYFCMYNFAKKANKQIADIKQIDKECRICDEYTNNKQFKSAVECYYPLVDKYPSHLEVRYFYAQALVGAGEFEQAKEHFGYIAANEVKNEQLIKFSKDAVVLMDEQIRKIEQSKRHDIGDYYSDLEDAKKWKNPHDLKVYIKGSKGRENILKKAFMIWDSAVSDVVNFSYTDSEERADIIASISDYQDVSSDAQQDAVGSTLFRGYKNSNYLYEVKIKISDTNQNGIKHSDTELLAIALHEIGHALGIASHSPQKGDAMYQDTSGYKYSKGEISNRDINTIKRIYGNI